MYQRIHEDLLAALKEKKDYRLTARRLNIGMALRQIKNRSRISTPELAQKTGINRNTLNTLMQIGEINTSQERFLKLVEHLGVSDDKFIRVARETARYNYYCLKEDEERKLKYKNYEVEVFSPPPFSRNDFLWGFVRIEPGRSIPDLIHDSMDQVAGFVTHGHLKLQYGGKSYSIHTNQSFLFDSRIKHSFENQAPSGTTEFYLLFQLKPLPSGSPEKRGRKSSPIPISTAFLIQQIRKELSPDPNRLLPMPALAALSGIALDALIHLSYRKTKIIPFEKLDLLANLTHSPFESIIQKAENRYQGWVRIFTDEDKATVDLSLRYGVRLTLQVGIGVGIRKYSIADATFESWKESERHKEWSYQGIGFIGIAVQRGSLGIQYGQQPLKILKWGETLYLNADIETRIFNALSEEKAREMGESPEAKALIFSCPPII